MKLKELRQIIREELDAALADMSGEAPLTELNAGIFNNSAMMKALDTTIRNPKTGEDIKVKSALNDKSHPAYNLAKSILDRSVRDHDDKGNRWDDGNVKIMSPADVKRMTNEPVRKFNPNQLTKPMPGSPPGTEKQKMVTKPMPAYAPPLSPDKIRMSIKELVKKLRSLGDSDPIDELAGEFPLTEKSVPEPYDRKGQRKMSKRQIEKRDKIGKAMKSDEKVADRFRKKHGQDWESWMWRSATAAAMRAK